MKEIIKNLTFICILMILSIIFPIHADAMEIDEPEVALLHTDFSNLEPEENYFFLLVKDVDAADLLDEDNLIYADQKKADKNGKVSFSYVPGYSGTAHVRLYGKNAEQMRELTWGLSDAGILTIYGSGEMEHYSKDNHAPWYSRRKEINEAVIKEGITGISSYAFDGCSELENIYFEGNAPQFEENCFYSLEAAVHYPRDNGTWTEEMKKDYGGKITWDSNEKRQQVIQGMESYSKIYGDEPFELDVRLAEGDGKLSYRTLVPEVATVSADGKVTILGAGKARILVEASETDTCEKAEFAVAVTVSKAEQEIEGTKNYSKTFGDDSFELDARLVRGDGELAYTSSAPEVAEVSDRGQVAVRGAGTAKITVEAFETDNYHKAELIVTVLVRKAEQTVEGTMQYGKQIEEGPFVLDAAVSTGHGKLNYVSSKPHVVTVNDVGLVTIKGIGEAKITITAQETENYDSCTYQVSIWVAADEMQSAIDRAKAEYEGKLAEKDSYIEESWDIYERAVARAEELIAKEGTTLIELQEALNGIEAAKPIIKTEKVKENLTALLQETGKLVESNYTKESWQKLQEVLAEANKLLLNENAAAEELQAIYEKATEAFQGLKPAENQEPESQKPESQKPENQAVKMKKIAFPSTTYSIAAGRRVKLKPRISPRNVSDKTLAWSVSNRKYATVKNGIVTTKKAGAGKKVVITATARDGSGVSRKVTVKIMKHAVKRINLRVAAKTVKAGSQVNVKAAIKTTGSKANRKLKWVSSDTKYAAVSKKGVVKTKKAGKGKVVIITAKSTDGTNKKATVKIRIK